MRIFCFLGKRGRRELAGIRRYDIIEIVNSFRYFNHIIEHAVETSADVK